MDSECNDGLRQLFEEAAHLASASVLLAIGGWTCAGIIAFLIVRDHCRQTYRQIRHPRVGTLVISLR